MAKKKKQAEASGGGDSNMAMTVSLFIIILAFFILLNALAVPDEKRKRVALGSLKESFGILSGGRSILEDVADLLTDSKPAEVSRLKELNSLLERKDEIVRDLTLTGDRHRSILSIPEHRLFKPGERRLLTESHAMLDKIGQIIKKNNYPVDIMGYVDNTANGSDQTMPPRELSTFRAMALQLFFIENNQVPPSLLSAYGWGEFRPVASKLTPETRKLNQRVEVVFIHDLKPEKPEGAFTFKDFFFNVFEKRKP